MIVIVDYGLGNLRSIEKAFKRIGCVALISAKKDDVLRAEKLVLPGVGNFKQGIENLKNRELIESLNEAVSAKGIPVLGICLGMQLMAGSSEEGNCAGLRWIDAEVVKFSFAEDTELKIPHIGWNSVKRNPHEKLFDRIAPEAEFYFVHSYCVLKPGNAASFGTTFYGTEFVSYFQKENIYGVQFHPEKSHQAGLALIANFVQKT
jgi:imidazole glycerol-phosphate synthase subunit HisH